MLALVAATLGITHDDWHHPHRPRCPDARVKGGVQVTPDEIQAMREKHFFWKDKECNWDGEPYPCDVIKVLDAWEAETNPDIGASATSDTLPESECDHPIHRHSLMHDPSHCPKCGEKL